MNVAIGVVLVVVALFNAVVAISEIHDRKWHWDQAPLTLVVVAGCLAAAAYQFTLGVW